jgi:chromosome segregation ATPase
MIIKFNKYLLFFITISFFSCNQNSEVADNNISVMDSVNTVLEHKSQELEQLNQIISNKDSINNEYALYIQNIKNNLREIQKSESIVQNHRSNPEFFLSDSMDISAEILKMAGLIKENQSLISKLNVGLKKSNNENQIYKSQVVDLSEKVASSNREIFYLHEELESLDASFKDLFENYTEKVNSLNELEIELDQVWYTFGTKSELINNNVISKEGGFIGLGKVKKLK